jgi:hypothetical protein
VVDALRANTGGREDLAADAFRVVLSQQPFAELDGIRTSPKVLAVFREAQKSVSLPDAEGEAGEAGAGDDESKSKSKSKSNEKRSKN